MLFVLSLASVIACVQADSVPRNALGARDLPVGIGAMQTGDTARADTVPKARRRRSTEISDGYSTRLAIHKTASLATLPLFAAQMIVGTQMYNATSHGEVAPGWVKGTHRPLAYALGGLFLVNGVTGSLNWWESRHQEKGRAWRTAHALLMLASEGGFAYTGVLGSRLPLSAADRDLHRRWAIGSMSVALASYVMMLKPIRRD